MLKQSRFVKVLTYDFGKIEKTLFHQLTGENRLMDVFSEKVWAHWKLFSQLPSSQRRKLGSGFNAKQKQFLDAGFVYSADQFPDERTLYLDYYPVLREGCLYYKQNNGLRIHFSVQNQYFGKVSMRSLKLNPLESRFLKNCDGKKSLRTILKKLFPSCPESELVKTFALQLSRLFHTRYQLFRLHKNQNTRTNKIFYSSLKHPARIAKQKSKSHRNRLGNVDLTTYHKKEIVTAMKQFNHVETTVSHAFRAPSETLGGLSYGAAFLESTLQIPLFKIPRKILEVGGGTGIFAYEFLKQMHKAHPHQAKELTYHILDLSPTLQKSQKKQLSPFKNQVSLHLQNASQMNVKEKFSLIISNEVIADFKTVLVTKAQLKANSSLAAQTIKELKIDVHDSPEKFYFNLGAIQFLRKVFNHLDHNGVAVITEYGGLKTYPTPTLHLNHDEYSIHWGHLLQAAHSLGFSYCTLKDMQSFINWNPHTRLFSGDQYCLQKVAARFNHHVDHRVYSEKEISILRQEIQKKYKVKIQGLQTAPAYEHKYLGPPISAFKALIVQKP